MANTAVTCETQRVSADGKSQTVRKGWLVALIALAMVSGSCLCFVPAGVYLAGEVADEMDRGTLLPGPTDPPPTNPPPIPAPVSPTATPTNPPPPTTPPPTTGPAPTNLPAPPTASEPRRITVHLDTVEGIALSAANCTFEVGRFNRRDGSFWCQAQVRCEQRLLYGGNEAGFFNCTLYEEPERHVVGSDAQTTREDGDAAFSIDTLRGTFSVHDDVSGTNGEFRVEGSVLTVE